MKRETHWSDADIEKVKELAAQGLTAGAIAVAVGRSEAAIYNLRKSRGCFTLAYVKPRADCPADFAENWQKMSQRELVVLYSRSLRTIARWCDENNLYRPKAYNISKPRVEKAPKPVKAKKHAKPLKSTYLQTAAPDRPHVDPTPAGQAAEFLRQFGPVIRCNERGQYDPAGNRWRRGAFLLTADEIIQRAQRNGWTGGKIAA